MKRIQFFFILLFMGFNTYSQVSKSSFDYAIKSGDTLRLDKYEVKNNIQQSKPCIIFMFGGGFVSGQRDAEYYLDYFNEMVKKGYIVISIDYRLGLKSVAEAGKNGEKVKPLTLPKQLENAINIAVEDLYDATNFILSKTDEWQINPQEIILNGSSAGAISVLQAEYYCCSNNQLAKKLPNNFNYAGVISFAGAIFSSHGKLHWDKQPSPILFFHGNADSNVPYDGIKILKYRFIGSKKLVKQLTKIKSPYYFYDVNNANHIIAISPMNNNITEIEEFTNNYILNNQNLEIHKKVNDTQKTELNKKIKLKDYIISNFKPSDASALNEIN